MNTQLHSDGNDDFIKNLKKELEEKISNIKNSKEFSFERIKKEIDVLKRKYHKIVKNSRYNNF